MDNPITTDEPNSKGKSSMEEATSSPSFIHAWEAVRRLASISVEDTEAMGPRSFDQGDVKCPDETAEEHAKRIDLNNRFDAAELDLIGFLSLGQLTATGKRPAENPRGQQIHEASFIRETINPERFQDSGLAFGSEGELIRRLETIETVFPNHSLHGSNADPRFPLYYNVQVCGERLLILQAELRRSKRAAGQAAEKITDALLWMTKKAQDHLDQYKSKPKGDMLVPACIEACRCTNKEAKAAFKDLPDHLRRTRGERV